MEVNLVIHLPEAFDYFAQKYSVTGKMISSLLLTQKHGGGYPPQTKGINRFLEVKLMGGVTPP